MIRWRWCWRRRSRALHRKLPPSHGGTDPIISILGALLRNRVHDPEGKDITKIRHKVDVKKTLN
jgi:hypothetical protein